MVNTSSVLLVLQMMFVGLVADTTESKTNITSPRDRTSDDYLLLRYLLPEKGDEKMMNDTGREPRSMRAEYAFSYYDNYNRRTDNPTRRQERPRKKDNHHHGIHVANWRWDEIGVFFTFTCFVVVTGLAKVGELHQSPTTIPSYAKNTQRR
ncbi:hypothetical protein RUM44_010127 [Polyplax serrata]|uniref:Uncharacterized protein n=1 Tax=Polyplax serrata TaxID=468196 RepID=A0ABR1AUY0_POLSC